MSENRTGKRLPVVRSMSVKIGNLESGLVSTRNVSETGAYVSMPGLTDPLCGSDVWLTIRDSVLPVSPVRGRIVRQDDEGIAVRFI